MTNRYDESDPRGLELGPKLGDTRRQVDKLNELAPFNKAGEERQPNADDCLHLELKRQSQKISPKLRYRCVECNQMFEVELKPYAIGVKITLEATR